MTKPIPELTPSQRIRFFAKINKDGPQMPGMLDRCWIWTAGRDQWNYGRFNIGGNVCKAHRISFALIGGIFNPDQPLILHRCDNPPCCNPAHLFIGTDAENAADREKKGRGKQPSGDRHMSRTKPETLRRGDNHPNSKLTTEKVLEIRAKYSAGGASHRALARAYGVGFLCISRIARRLTWSHI